MTTTTSPSLPSAGGPITPQPPAPHPPRRRAGMIAAITALTLATAALTLTVTAIAHPRPAAQHTIIETPPPATVFSDKEIQTAKANACTAWDQTARAGGAAARISNKAIDKSGWRSPESLAAIDNEKNVGTSTIAYLRTQIRPATPESVRIPVDDWIRSNIDILHLANMRNWSQYNAEADRGNALADTIKAACGMS